MEQSIVARLLERLPAAFREDDPAWHQKASESENVSRVREQYEAIARGDFAAFTALLSEDAEFEIVGVPEIPFVRKSRGRDAILAALRHNFSHVADQQPEILSVVAQGDVVGRERGRMRESGREYALHWVQQFTFREGLLARIWKSLSDG
jgi:ketosteroid isomerase-like protein